MPGSRRWLLRAATAAAHETVDAVVGDFRDRGGYESFLRASLAFREPIENALGGMHWPNALGAWRPDPITPAIRSDMRDLDLPIPTAPAIDVPSTVPELLGTLYVLEGSALGARVLLERVKTLGFTPSYGARHLARLAGGFDRWRDFLALLETAEPFDLGHATAASLKTFAAAETAFRRMTNG